MDWGRQMSDSLFEEGEIKPCPSFNAAAMKERFISCLADELLLNPPIKSLGIGEADRHITAKKIAAKDASRALIAIHKAGLEIGDKGRIADFKACLADWVREFEEGQRNGGNPTETDIEELAQRTRRML